MLNQLILKLRIGSCLISVRIWRGLHNVVSSTLAVIQLLPMILKVYCEQEKKTCLVPLLSNEFYVSFF